MTRVLDTLRGLTRRLGASTEPAETVKPTAVALVPEGPVRRWTAPVRTASGVRMVRLQAELPTLPRGVKKAVFGEHSTHTGEVIVLAEGAAVVSADLGASWSVRPIGLNHRAGGVFTTSTGTRLVVTEPQADADLTETFAFVHRFDRDWSPAGAPFKAAAPWHGAASIGEARGVLMFAEYPQNDAKYPAKDPAKISPDGRVLVSPRVWRSRDDGASWEAVFQVSHEQVRHLHTVQPDPGRPGRWWLSSGDRAEEVFVWRSDDDGDSWVDVTAAEPDIPHHRTCKPRSCQRMTDLAFHDGWKLWGADDWLGSPQAVALADEAPRAGARLFRARTDGAFEPEAIGFIGPPVRSLVDAGEAWLLLTEAKDAGVGWRAEAHIAFKDEPGAVHRLAVFDNHLPRGTGFTYSRASRRTVDGVFFSMRSIPDVFDGGPRVIRWTVAID